MIIATMSDCRLLRALVRVLRAAGAARAARAACRGHLYPNNHCIIPSASASCRGCPQVLNPRAAMTRNRCKWNYALIVGT